MKGFVKFFRSWLNEPIFQNEKLWKVWSWCLLKATHSQQKTVVGTQVIILNSGDFIFGRKRASQELNMPESTVYRYLKLLEEMNYINIKPNNRFSVVTVLAQGFENDKENNWTTDEQQTNNKRTTDEQQMDTNKNVKNVKNVENIKKQAKKELAESFEQFWNIYPRKANKAQAKKAWGKIQPNKNLQDEIIQGVKKHNTTVQWQKDNGQFIPYPSTFLNQQRWKDEITTQWVVHDNAPSYDIDKYIEEAEGGKARVSVTKQCTRSSKKGNGELQEIVY